MAEEAPGFRQPIKSIAVIKGKPAKFEAIVTGNPEPDVSWYLNGKEVAHTDKTQISREDGGRASLVLTSVTDDGGNVACTARNAEGSASSTAKLVVREPPDFVQRLKSQRVKEGSRVEMVVRFRGTPMPKIRWYRERAELQSTEDFRIVTEGDTSRLIIEEVYEDDSGKFSATATNVVGRVISAAHLMVTDTTPPATPTGRLSTPGKLTPGASPGLAPSPAGAAAAPVTPMTGAPVAKDAAVVKPLAVKPADEAAPVAVKAGEKRPAEAKAGEIPSAKKVASKDDEQKPVPMEVDQAAGKAAGEAVTPRVAGDGQEEVRPAAEGTDKEAKGAAGKAKVISPPTGKKKQVSAEGGKLKREGSGDDTVTSPSQLRRQGDLITSPSQLRRQGTDDSASVSSFHTATGEEVMSISSYATAEAGTLEGSPSVQVPQPKLFMSGLLSGIPGAFSSLHAGQAGLALNQQQTQMASEVSTIEEMSEGEEDELAGAPEFNRGLESCQVARGESVRFECEISGSPPPTIIWLKDGKEIDEDNQHFAKYGDDGSFALVITNVTDADSGAYSCQATSKKGQATSTAELTVKPQLPTPGALRSESVTDTGMTLAWLPTPGATDYEVSISPPVGDVHPPSGAPTEPQRVISGLEPAKEYEVTVTAKIGDKRSAQCEPFKVTTKPLGTPAGFNANKITDNSMFVSWTPVNGATDYEVRLDPPAGDVKLTEKGSTVPERQLTGLSGGIEYRISVGAKNQKGDVVWAEPFSVDTKDLPTPSGTDVSGLTDNEMTVAWKPVPGATDYILKVQPQVGEVQVPPEGPGEARRHLTGLLPNVDYTVVVEAKGDKRKRSAPCAPIKVKTKALCSPSDIKPSSVTASTAMLEWEMVPGATDYKLHMEPSDGQVTKPKKGGHLPQREVTNLTPGREYVFKITAVSPAGNSAPSEEIKINTPALAAPSEVKQATVANEEIVLKWKPVAGATDYELTVEPPAGDIVAMKGDRARPMRRLTGLTPGTEYKIVVVAKDAKGNTRKSDTISATTLNIPKAEGLRAYDITDTTVYLQWSAISGSKDYTINLRPSAIASVSAPENDMTKPERLVQGLQPSTEYNISVSAITADGRGPPCNPVTIVTKALPMPEDLKLVNVSDEAALITWAPIEGAKNFHVTVEPEGPEVVPTEVGETASQRVLRGLQPASDYWVTVTAKNEEGDSNESQTFSFKTMALSTPSGFKTSHVTDTTCVLSWTSVSGSEDYTVKVQPQVGEIAVPPAGKSASERHLKGLKGKTTYTVTIVATSSKGTSAESQTFTFTTAELSSPSGVEVSSVTASGLELAWTPVPGAIDYIVTSEPDARVSPGEGGKSGAKRTVSGLEPGTEYTFTVVAVSTEGSSAACEPVKVKTRVLDTPAKIEAATATTNTAVITWTAVKGATDYKIRVEPPGAEVSVDKEGPAAPKRILKGLHPDTHYHVYVTAISAAGESTQSEALEIQTAALPSPTRVSAPTVTDRNVIVSWAPTEGAEEYIVKVEPACEVVPTAGGPGAPERELRNLKPATEYTIRIAAKGPLGTSADSEPLPIRTNALPAPSMVEVPFVSDKEVRVSWPAVPGATDYHVKTQPEASVQAGEGGPGAPERIVTGLKPNTEYSIRVVALTQKGSSGLTEPVKVTTKALETPSKIQPTSTTADTAVITWSAVKGATDYRVVVEPSGPEVAVDKEGPAAPKRILKGLQPDTEYIAYVTAIGAAGDSTRSEPLKLKTPGLPVPARLGTPTVTDRSVIVSWAPTEGAEEYIVKVEPACEVVPTAGGPGAPERELRNLKPATEYIVRVAAKFPQGTSAESEHLAIRTNALPAPAGVEVPFVSDKEVRVSWPAVPGATDYHVKTQPEASVQLGEGGPGAPERIVTGLNSKTEYSIRVVALTQKGSSALSEPVKVTTKALPRPNEGKVKSVTDNSAIITWTGIQGAADYQISVEPKCEVKQTIKASAPERELRGLLSGTEYTVTITAVGKAGTSAVSEPLIVRTKALSKPSRVTAGKVGDTSAFLEWAPAEAATNYVLTVTPTAEVVPTDKGPSGAERVLKGLKTNTEYTVSVTAKNPDGTSAPSDEFVFKTKALPSPGQPSQGAVTDTTATVSWAAVPGASDYAVKVEPEGQVMETAEGAGAPVRQIQGLKPGTEYKVVVSGKGEKGDGAECEPIVIKTNPLPSPSAVKPTSVEDNKLTLAWSAVPGATDYKVVSSPEDVQVVTRKGGRADSERVITGLRPGTEYSFSVVAICPDGNSAQTEPVKVTTKALPTPGGVKAGTVGDNTATVVWSNVPGASDYSMQVEPAGEVVVTKEGPAAPVREIRGLQAGQEYKVAVIGKGPSGESAPCEPISIKTNTLATPSGLKPSTVDDSSLTLAWTSVPGATDYVISGVPDGAKVSPGKDGPAGAERVVTGLQAATDYSLSVTAVSSKGESGVGQPLRVTTKALPTPDDVAVSSSADSATISWAPVPGARDYEIVTDPPAEVSPTEKGPSAAERVVKGLKPGTDYEVKIAATNDKGVSNPCRPVKFSTKACQRPTGVKSPSITDNQATITWSPVPGATDYRVLVEPAEGSVKLPTGGPGEAERTLVGLTAGAEYTVSVIGMTEKGSGEASEPVKITTRALSAPSGIKPSSLTETGATIAWKPVPGATNYSVSVSPAHGRVVESSGGAAGAERRLTDLKPNTEYTVSIAAEGVKGTSATSPPVVIKTKDDEERKRREAEELRQKQQKEEEERKQQELLKQQKEEEQRQQALLDKQRKDEEQRKQQELLDKQRREKEEKELLEKQRREEEEKRRQQELLDKQRQEEEDKKRKELAEKERIAEQRKQELLEKQRQDEEEARKKKELLEKQRREDEDTKQKELLEKQRREEEDRKQKELLEKQRKLEEEKKQKELQEKQRKEEEQKKQLEKQRKEEEYRKQKALLEKKRKEEEERKQKELLEKQKKEEEEKKRKELEKKRLEDEKKRKELEKQKEEERKKKELLEKKKKEEEQKQKELLEKKKKEEEDQKKKQLLEKKKKDEEAAAAAPEEPVEEEEEISTGISAFAEARQAAMVQQSIEVRPAPVVTIDASAYAAMAVAHYPTSVRTSLVQDRTLMLNWDPVVGAEDYDVSFEPCGDAEVFLTDYGPVAPMRKIRGLKPCKTYKITVAAKKANKERTKESESVTVTTKALPSPSEFRAIRCLDNKVLFGFDAVYGATSYIVGTDSKEGVSRVTRMDYDRVEVEITDLLPATEYQVTVTAQGPKGVSAPSKYFTIGTKVITEPENLVAKADSENDMTVTWSHVIGATDYEFHISPEGKVKEAGSTTRKVSGLKPGVEYRIAVAAKKGELVGSSAITRSFTKALARPESMRCVSASDTSVTVAWNRVQGATGYDVETRPSGGTAITPRLPGAPEREITGLRPATEYEIIITGRSSRGDGLASKPLKIKTKAFGAVSSIRLSECTDTKALIRWSPVNGATSYDVKLDPSEGRIRQTNGSQSPERQVTGLSPNKEYSVIIIPKSASGEGSVNKPFSFTTMALSSPTNIKVTDITEEGMSLTWDEVPGAYDYTVWMDPPGATIIAGPRGDKAPERHISRLKSNKEYTITIVAESPRGNSCRSDPIDVTTEALHGPTGLKTTNITQTGMRLSFNPVANARDYEVILRPRLGNVFAPGRGNDPSQPERIIEDLKPNTEYDISVIAITTKGVKSEVSKSIKRRTYGTGRRKRKRRRNTEKDRQRRRERRKAARESKRKGLARRRRATIKKKWRRRKKNSFYKKPWRFGWQ